MNDAVVITRDAVGPAGGYGRVLAFIRDQLLSGRVKVGDRLLSERDLAGVLGVSRPVIREALRSLAAIGAVEIRRGQGTVVRRPNFSVLGDFFGFVLAQQSNALDDVMEARVAIERHAIRLACFRATPSDIERISDAFDRIVRTMSDPSLGGAADFHFHTMIVEAAHSATLSSIYAAISNLLQRSHAERRLKIVNVKGIDSFLIDHHREILDAIVARDSARAEELLAAHFEIGANLRRGQPPKDIVVRAKAASRSRVTGPAARSGGLSKVSGQT
jgi:DNA-binding FadR family transcriptional regulator